MRFSPHDLARRLAGFVVLTGATLVLVAQTNAPDPLDKAKTAAYYLRYRDEIRAKEAVERSRKLLRTPAFRDALHNTTATLPRLFVTADRFVTATGITFDAFQLGLPEGMMRGGAKVTLFGEVTDSAGKIVTSLEEPAVVSESKTDRFVEHVLFLPVWKASLHLESPPAVKWSLSGAWRSRLTKRSPRRVTYRA